MSSIRSSADRNLLAGIFALQHDFVTRDQLVAAMNHWVLQKGTQLEDLLPLESEDRAALDVMLRRHLAKHRHDVQQSLRALPVDAELRRRLEQVPDTDVAAHLADGRADNDGILATLLPASGEGGMKKRFRPLHEHAKGGLGVVYLAVDQELDREVAIKEIREDCDPDHAHVRARFRREAEITGKLEHPGVVPVYSLGCHTDGRPYYAMRFVQGEPMSEAIKRFHAADGDSRRDPTERSLALRKLLNRFVAVCNTIEHAHSKGVIHRDLKPQNVLLGDHGETLVIDWGLARALGPAGGESTATVGVRLSDGGARGTMQGEVMGTPAFLPPEQARGEVDRVGRASDVWALGATLYCVMTGKPPYEGGDALARAKHGETIPARQANRRVPAALEVVCRKAMAKFPHERYAKAKDLAEDVERWLADEPVRACREPWREKARRWARRHRTLVGVAAAVLLTAVVASDVALYALGTEQRRTAGALSKAEANLRQAEANLALAKDAVDKCFNIARENPTFQQPRMEEAKKLLLATTLPFYQEFRCRSPDDCGLRREEGIQHFNVAYIEQHLGRGLIALPAFELARQIQSQLAAANPNTPGFQQDLARTHGNLGNLHSGLGKGEEALEEFRRAREIYSQLVAANPDSARYRQELATTHNNLGNLLRSRGKSEPALKEYQSARAILKKLAEAHPEVSAYRMGLARAYNNLGAILGGMGKSEVALAEFRQARDIQTKLSADYPNDPQYQHQLASTLNNLGNTHRSLGRRAEALKDYLSARDVLGQLTATHPDVPRYQQLLANTYNNLGILLGDLGKPESALREYQRSREIQLKLATAHPEVPEYRNSIGGTLVNLAILQSQAGKPEEALHSLNDALPHLQVANQREPRHPTYRLYLRTAYLIRAASLGQVGRHREAVADWERGVELSPPMERVGVLVSRADSLARAGDYARAGAEADALARTPLTGSLCYELGNVHALNAASVGRDEKLPLAVREVEAERYAQKAVALLRRAFDKGLFRERVTLDHMRKDADLLVLHGRDDYRRLVAELERRH